MKSNTVCIGNVYHHIQRVDSTNNFLSRLIASDSPIEGTVISAEKQTAGRGQYSRSWYASPGKNILFSTVLYPEFLPTSRQFCLNMMVSNGLRRALSSYVPEVTVKWPNDLMIDQRKLAGILIQSAIQKNDIQHTIIGIGCNVNEIQFPDFKRPAVSLKLLTGKAIDRRYLETSIFDAISSQYERLKQGEVEKVCTEYNRYLWGKGSKQWFESEEGRISAILLGVGKNGDIHLSIDGEEQIFSSEKISYVQ